MKNFAVTFTAAACMISASAVFADENCLIGTWVSAEETATQTEQMSSAQNGGLAQTVAIVSGSVSIEIDQDSTARITYDNYTAALTTTIAALANAMSARSRTVRSVYSGNAEGMFFAQGDKLALGRFSEVDFEVLIQLPNGTFVPAESGTKLPPHEKGDYVFECDGSELLLTSPVHDFFLNAEYRGRFTRSN